MEVRGEVNFSPATAIFSCAHISHTIDRRCRQKKFKWRMLCVFGKQTNVPSEKHAHVCWRARSSMFSYGHSFFFSHALRTASTRTLYELKFIHDFPPLPFAPYRFTMSISNQSSDKREAYDDGLQDLGVPGAVQTFLWSQIAPFVRPKLGKLHEAACQVSYFHISI